MRESPMSRVDSSVSSVRLHAIAFAYLMKGAVQVLALLFSALLCSCAVCGNASRKSQGGTACDSSVKLVVRQWYVSKRIASTPIKGGMIFDMNEYALAHGITFPPGATFMTGFRDTRIGLINTVDNLDRFEWLLKKEKWFLGYAGERQIRGNIQNLASFRKELSRQDLPQDLWLNRSVPRSTTSQ